MLDTADWARGDLLARADRLRKTAGGASGLAKGRVLTAFGWHRFQAGVAVAEVLLHIESRRPLMITRFNSATTLIERDRYVARSFLLACCVEIARSLQTDLGIDQGWLDWKVRADHVQSVLETAEGFTPVSQRTRGLRGATYVTLRRR
jgi:hypothetical protein